MSLRFLNHLDILTCDHGGVVDLLPGIDKSKQVFSEQAHLLNDTELLKSLIYNCSQPAAKRCHRVVSIELGLSNQAFAKKHIPLLENLSSTTNSGGKVKLSTSLKDQLLLHEGRKKHVYLDSAKIPTIGVGFNLTRSDADAKLSALHLDPAKIKAGTQDLDDASLDALTDGDIPHFEAKAKSAITDWNALSPDQQNALSDLSFNAGHVWSEVADPVNKGDFDGAADALYNMKLKKTDKDGKVTHYNWRDIQPTRSARLIAALRGHHVRGTPA